MPYGPQNAEKNHGLLGIFLVSVVCGSGMLALDLREGLIEVGDDVFNVLNTN